MEENKKISPKPEDKPEDKDALFAAEIEKIKDSMVSKEQYDALQKHAEESDKKNSELLKALINGKHVDDNKPTEEEIDIKALQKELYGGHTHLSNREYVEKTLKLRKGIMQKGGDDPFLPQGSSRIPYAKNEHDEKIAQNVADNLEECLKFANGDDKLFNSELDRRLKEPIIPKKADKDAVTSSGRKF